MKDEFITRVGVLGQRHYNYLKKHFPMLDLGILLSSKIEKTTIGGCKVFNVADGFLYACFDNNISDEVVTATRVC